MKTSSASNLFVRRIKQWLAPPEFVGDEQKTRRVRLLNIITLIGLLYLSLTIPILLLEGRTHDRTLMVNLVVLAVSPVLKYLLH